MEAFINRQLAASPRGSSKISLNQPIELLTVLPDQTLEVQVLTPIISMLTVPLQADALEFMRTLNKPVHAISIAGIYIRVLSGPFECADAVTRSAAGVAREGKSAFLSMLMRLIQGDSGLL